MYITRCLRCGTDSAAGGPGHCRAAVEVSGAKSVVRIVGVVPERA